MRQPMAAPILRCRPDLVKGMPICRLSLALAWEIPRNLFQEKPPLFMIVSLPLGLTFSFSRAPHAGINQFKPFLVLGIFGKWGGDCVCVFWHGGDPIKSKILGTWRFAGLSGIFQLYIPRSRQ